MQRIKILTIKKKTDGFAYLNMHCHLFLGSQSEIMYI